MDSGPGSVGYPGTPQASSPFLFGWTPQLREAIDDTWEAWVAATARTIDAMHNNGWIAGGVDQAVAHMVGAGLHLNAKPEVELFADETAAEDWSAAVERRFEQWANDPWSCDLGGRSTLPMIARQAVKQYFASGEIVATLPFRERLGSSHGTKVNLLPSSRLTQTSNSMKNLVQGVVLDSDGAPTAYEFIIRDPVNARLTTQIVNARDAAARPVVMHLFENAPSAVRGITPLAPCLNVVRQLDQLADATLTSAMIQAIFSATIESDSPTADVMAALQDVDEQETRGELEGAQAGDFQNLMESRFEWYRNTKIDLGKFGKIAHMFPGESLKFNRSEAVNENYEPFTKALLREMARCMGITYEQMTGDYSGATYSSVRMATADMWLINLSRRSALVERLYQTVYEAWLEEDIDKGFTPFPGGAEAFRNERSRACRADWRGPPRPSADETKAAQALQIAVEQGWIPREQAAAEYGNDWRDVDRQQAMEKQSRDELGLTPPPPPQKGGGPDGNAIKAPNGAPDQTSGATNGG
jgi:lambda family phage portal protein